MNWIYVWERIADSRSQCIREISLNSITISDKDWCPRNIQIGISCNSCISAMCRKTISNNTLTNSYHWATSLPDYVDSFHIVEMSMTQINIHQRAPYISLTFLPCRLHIFYRARNQLLFAFPTLTSVAVPRFRNSLNCSGVRTSLSLFNWNEFSSLRVSSERKRF